MRAPLRSIGAALALSLVVATFLGAAPAAAVAVPPPVSCSGSPCWHPALNARWQYQLQGVSAYASTGGIAVGLTAVPFTGGAAAAPAVYDIDLYVDEAVSGNNTTLDSAAVNAIHAQGAKAICYVDAGTWENWRADAGAFPASVKGKNNGWPGEKWLDIRQTATLVPIMDARLAKCVQAGFDAVEWDNMDGYSNASGFPLTANDQLAYNATLANLAHSRGLTVGLKNDVDQLSSLAPYFDFAVNEQCQQFSECGGYNTNFVAAGKAVFQVEYKLAASKFCAKANTNNRNAIKKTTGLKDTPWTPCR